MNQQHQSTTAAFVRRRADLIGAVLALVAVAASMYPLLARGFAMGHDWIFELVRIAEFGHALRDGQWPPFWASNLYQGFGSPIFLFYPPLYLATAAMFGLFGMNTEGAAVAALCFFTLVGASLMWRFVRGICPDTPGAAAVAVVLFSLHPYLLADKWIRNANAEFAALCLLPAVLIGATAATSRAAFWWTTGSLAMVVLSHNIVALVAAGLAIGTALYVRRSVRAMLPVFAGMFGALAVTAFFWVPAFSLQPLIRTEELLTGKFDFHMQFPKLIALVWPADFYSGGWLTPLLLISLLFARPADIRARRIAQAVALASAMCVFLMLPFSRVVWETLPLLRFAQFPWRFMGPLAVLLAAGAAIAAAPFLRGRWNVAIQVSVLALALLNALSAFRQFEPIAPEFAGRIEPVLTADGIRTRDLRTTANDEYLPRSADGSAIEPKDGYRLFKKWAFPVWSARRGAEPAEVESGPGGVVAVPLRSEADEIVLTLREPPVRRFCKIISLASIAVLVGYAAVENMRRRGRPSAGVSLPNRGAHGI